MATQDRPGSVVPTLVLFGLALLGVVLVIGVVTAVVHTVLFVVKLAVVVALLVAVVGLVRRGHK